MRTSSKLFSVLLASSIVAAPGLALASPVDTFGDGRGASCERGNASFCDGGSGGGGSSDNGGGSSGSGGGTINNGGQGGAGGQGGQGGQGGGGGSAVVDNTNTNRNDVDVNNRNTNTNDNTNINTNRNTNTNDNTNTNRNTNTANGGNANANAVNRNSNTANGGNANATNRNSNTANGGAGGAGGNGYGGNSSSSSSASATTGNNTNIVKGSRTNVTSNNINLDVPAIFPAQLPGPNGGVGAIGDIHVPLPGIQIGAFANNNTYSLDGFGGFGGGRNDYGVSVGFSMPLGTGMFRDAAQKEAARREEIGKAQLASLRFTLVQQALAMQNSGIKITLETFPEHYRALHGDAASAPVETYKF